MREIKFRLWSVYSKKMFDDGYYLSLDGDLFQDDELEYKNKSSFVIMQHTGLKDKNGKDIYEGDIIQTYKGDKGEIFFNNGMFQRKINKQWGQDLTNAYHCIVIGNIYEHPHLLEETE